MTLIDPFLRRSLERLHDLFCALNQGNITFLEQDDRPAHLHSLLDLRELTNEEISGLIDEMIEALRERVSVDYQIGGIGDLIALLKEVFPQEGGKWQDTFRVALADLVQSDQSVNEALEKRKITISDQIKTVRKGSLILRGYRQADPMGSCFIDKVK